MRPFLKGFGQFWYDFIIGDDWKIAVAVVAALALTLTLVVSRVIAGESAAVIGGITLLIAFAASMVIDGCRR